MMNKDKEDTDYYMNDEMLNNFEVRLLQMKESILSKRKEAETQLKLYKNAQEINDALMLAESSEKTLKEVDDALERIKNGTFGYCEEKGVEIGVGRLNVYPTARYSVEAQEEIDKRKRFLENDSNE